MNLDEYVICNESDLSYEWYEMKVFQRKLIELTRHTDKLINSTGNDWEIQLGKVQCLLAEVYGNGV